MNTSLLSRIETLSLLCASSDGRNRLSANLGYFDPRWTSSVAVRMSRQQTQTEKSHDFVFPRHHLTASKLTGFQYNPTREFLQSLAKRRHLLVLVKTLGPLNPAALKPSGNPRSARKSSGHRRLESEGAVAAGATGHTNAAVEVFLKPVTFWKRSSGRDSNRQGLIAELVSLETPIDRFQAIGSLASRSPGKEFSQ